MGRPITPSWFVRDLRPGAQGLDVSHVQRRLGAVETGTYDNQTAQRVRGLQIAAGLDVDGVVNKETAVVIG